MIKKSTETFRRPFACFLIFLTAFLCVSPIKADTQNYIFYEKNRRNFIVYTTDVDFEDAYLFICKRNNENGSVAEVSMKIISSVDGFYASDKQKINTGYDYHIMIVNKELQPLFRKLVLNYNTPNGTGNSGFNEDFTPYY